MYSAYSLKYSAYSLKKIFLSNKNIEKHKNQC